LRLDKFLKVIQLIKRRTVAKETAQEGGIYVNNKLSKPSYEIKIGDKILLDLWNYSKEVEVIDIPKTNNVKKEDIDNYIKVLNYQPKNSDTI